MVTLYVRDGCAYSAAVLHKVEELNLPVTIKNIKDEGVEDELIKKGGDDRVPFMNDEATGVGMYESSQIIDYLDEHYGKSDSA